MLTPLQQALLDVNHDLINQILLTGHVDVNVKDKYGDTPLHYVASHGLLKVELINLLISAGADVNAKNNYGCTPLHIASSRPNLEKTQALLNAGADVSIVDKYDETPLDYALKYKAYVIVEILKQYEDYQNPVKEPDVC